MIEVEVRIQNKMGLHARPAAMFVETAKKFSSTISIIKDGKEGNAKNILQVLSLGVDFGDIVTIRANGNDEEEAVKELVSLIKNVLPEIDK